MRDPPTIGEVGKGGLGRTARYQRVAPSQPVRAAVPGGADESTTCLDAAPI
jgi:hypothetical protein